VRRRLLNVLTALSLVLCVATVVLCVRSYWILDATGRVGQVKVIWITSGVGSLHLGVTPADPENEEPGPRPYYFYNNGGFARGRSGVFSGGSPVRFEGRIDARSGFGWILVPHWLLALVLAVPPGLAMRKRRASWWSSSHFRVRMGPLVVIWMRRKPMPINHCRSCGYDLRATPDRCPECGTEAKAVRSNAACSTS
jgi:hypothetical protein